MKKMLSEKASAEKFLLRIARRGMGTPEQQLQEILLSARREQNLTQQELAKKSGVTQPDISRLENGRGNPSLQRLKALAKGLGMELRIQFIPIEEDGIDPLMKK